MIFCWGSIIGTFLIILWIWRFKYKLRNYPPSYTGFPLLGVIPFLATTRNPAEIFHEWGQELGPVMSLRIGTRDWVFLNNYEWIKRVFVDYGKYTSERTWGGLFQINSGFIFARDHIAKKKIMAASMRKYYCDKRAEHMIQEEIQHLLAEMKLNSDEAVDIKKNIGHAIENLLLTMIFGKRFEYGDPWFVKYTELMSSILDNSKISPILLVFQFFPWLRFLPIISQKWKEFKILSEIERGMMWNKTLEKQKLLLNENRKPNCFIEDLLSYKDSKTGESLTMENVIGLTSDLFVGGTENSISSLTWMMLYCATHPETQDKICDEIRSVMVNSPPSMNHKPKMKFTSSFIDEVVRHRTGEPLSMPHSVSEDVVIDGCKLKKDQLVIMNLWSAHREEKHFKDSEKFIPERFINEKTGKYEKSKYVIPFGIGPRMCLGYKLGEMQLFLILCGILQKYEVLPCGKMPNFHEGNLEFVYRPFYFLVKIKSR